MDKIKEYKKITSLFDSVKFLNNDDFSFLLSIQTELEDTFSKAQMFRTRTEMEVSVLNDLKFPTADAKYWQAVREQECMITEVIFLCYDYKKNLIEIKQLEEKFDDLTDNLDKELLNIEISKKMFISKIQEKTMRNRIKEIKNWHEIKERLLPQLEYGDEDVNDHQLLSYAERFINQYLTIGQNGDPAEINNILGQMVTTLNYIKSVGLYDKLISKFNTKNKKLIEQFLIS